MNKERARLKQELNRLRRQKSILWLGILFLVAILIWTALSIFTSQRKVKIDQNLTELAKPLVPRLETSVFLIIEEKRLLSDEELKNFPIYVYLKAEGSRSKNEGIFTNITDLSVNIGTSNAEEVVEENNF